jgi:hypothetical protein
LLDGGSYMLDHALRIGFRTTNRRLVIRIGNELALAFYADDALGFCNWWLRLLTGPLAGFTFAWRVYPHLDRGFAVLARWSHTPARIAVRRGEPLARIVRATIGTTSGRWSTEERSYRMAKDLVCGMTVDE